MMAKRTEELWGPGPSLAPKGHPVISLKEPQVTLDVAGRKVTSSPSCIVMGIDGQPKAKQFTTHPQLLIRKFYLCTSVPAHA